MNFQNKNDAQPGNSPLRGIKVLELGAYITAPYAAALLGDLGAEVVKIEPLGGDPMRSWNGGTQSPSFQAFNKSKRSLQLNLKDPEDRAVFQELLADADVLVHNSRLESAIKLGIDYASISSLRPDLVYCEISGFGPVGPRAGLPCFNQVGQGISGLDSLLVDPLDPQVTGPATSDIVTALFAVQGILAALVQKDRTGAGARVDVNMLASTMAMVSAEVQGYLENGDVAGPQTRTHFSQSYVLPCRDNKLIALHMSSPEKFWQGLLQVLDAPELANDPRFTTWFDRRRNYEALRARLGEFFSKQDRDVWLLALEAADVPSAPVLNIDELEDHAQVQALGLVQRTESGAGFLAAPWMFDGKVVTGAPAPELGQNNDEYRHRAAVGGVS